jgi:hypothetical protein
MTLHVVYFMRPVTQHAPPRTTAELRYSLRSLERNLSGLGEVHVFGGGPAWLAPTVHHHHVRQPRTKHENTWRIWLAIAEACRFGDVPDRFLLMNDDFFAVGPVDEVPPMTHGTIGEWVAARRTAGARGLAAVMEHTRDVLGPGADSLPSFELHVPLPCDRATFGAIVPELAASVERRGRLAKRTTYANLAGLKDAAVEVSGDVKIRTPDDPAPGGPWWSTSDEAFAAGRFGGAGRVIRDMFVTPSRFEVA